MRPKATTPYFVLRTCEQCGIEFRARSWNVNLGRGRFCSQRCFQTPRPATPTVLDDGAFAIPLHDRQGRVRAHVVVDASDIEWASQWRWYLGSEGYAERVDSRERGRRHLLLHREMFGLGRGDGLEVDHLDRDRLNCRRSNLRVIPKGKNEQNLSGYGATSKHRGVCWVTKAQKWRAMVSVNGKRHFVGYFATEQEAAEAARNARKELMPYAVD